MDIGAKVRDGSSARAIGGLEFKFAAAAPSTIVPRDVRNDHDRRRGTGLATSRVSFGGRTTEFCIPTFSTTVDVEGFS